MKETILSYEGRGLVITYDVGRCTHAGECVRGLPAVFQVGRRPWAEPDSAAVDEVVATISQCPSGALKYERGDGGDSEKIPSNNTVTVSPDGPLYVRGEIEVLGAGDGVLVRDTRVALCRCGLSARKPLCDGTHSAASFEAG